MSKARPSETELPFNALPLAQRRKMVAEYWMERLFQSSYTRHGKLFHVRTWSVKIQHRSQRYTFALDSEGRTEAATEALSIYVSILTRGWKPTLENYKARMAPKDPEEASDPAILPKTDAGYWAGRLVRRPDFRREDGTETTELSARIHHDGLAFYFPLGSNDPGEAAGTALKIFRTILKDGWKAANQAYRKEITVAVFWSMNPLGYTYTSVTSSPHAPPAVPPAETENQSGALRVALIEGDPSVESTLRGWIDRHRGFRTLSSYTTGAEALQDLRNHPLPELILVNRTLPDMLGQEILAEVTAHRPDLPAFTYGIYEDSDQAYYSFSGVTGGYAMRRRPPNKLLEPIDSGTRPYSKSQAGLQIQHYFQNFFGTPTSWEEPPDQKLLTPREHEILDCVSKGFVDKEIAVRLGISPWTVHGHLKNIYDKLRVRTRTEAVVRHLRG